MTEWGNGARILQLLETPGVGPARVKALIAEAERERADLAEFLADRNALTRVLTPAQLEKFVEGEERVAELLRRLGTLRASLVAFTDGGYPRAVRRLRLIEQPEQERQSVTTAGLQSVLMGCVQRDGTVSQLAYGSW